MRSSVVRVFPLHGRQDVEDFARTRPDFRRAAAQGGPARVQKKFLPDGLSHVERVPFLAQGERIFLSQVQGCTFARMFSVFERFFGASVLELIRNGGEDRDAALQAALRLSEQEVKSREIFQPLQDIAGTHFPPGYDFVPARDTLAQAVPGKAPWALLALRYHFVLLTQAHYRESVGSDRDLSFVWKGVLLNHWRAESRHAIADELAWLRTDMDLSMEDRAAAVNDLVDLYSVLGGIAACQAQADARYFMDSVPRAFAREQERAVAEAFHAAYHWQYLGAGVARTRLRLLLQSMLGTAQMRALERVLVPARD